MSSDTSQQDELQSTFAELGRSIADFNRRFLNVIWNRGGCEAVKAVERKTQRACPNCGNSDRQGDGRVVTKAVDIGSSVVIERKCGKCQTEWTRTLDIVGR